MLWRSYKQCVRKKRNTSHRQATQKQLDAKWPQLYGLLQRGFAYNTNVFILSPCYFYFTYRGHLDRNHKMCSQLRFPMRFLLKNYPLIECLKPHLSYYKYTTITLIAEKKTLFVATLLVVISQNSTKTQFLNCQTR